MTQDTALLIGVIWLVIGQFMMVITIFASARGVRLRDEAAMKLYVANAESRRLRDIAYHESMGHWMNMIEHLIPADRERAEAVVREYREGTLALPNG